MGFFREFFSYDFLVNAFIASLLLALLTSIYSPIVVLKRMEFIGDGTAHAVFAGLAIAFFFNIDYKPIAMITAIVFGLLISFLSQKGTSENTAVGILLPVFMAFGMVIISFIKGYTPDIMSYLFGNILLIDSRDVLYLLLIVAVSIAIYIFMRKEILYFLADEKTARFFKVPIGFIRTVLLVGLSLTVVSAVKLSGVILIGAFLVIPGTIAKLFSRSFDQMILYSLLVTLSASIIGIFLSYLIDSPPGPTMILLLFGFYLVTLTKKAP